MAPTRKRRRRSPSRWSDGLDALHDYLREPVQRIGHRPSPPRDEGPIVVTDDWPTSVPINEAELRVIEGHFAKELDLLFGPLP